MLDNYLLGGTQTQKR